MILKHTAVGVFENPMQAMEAVRALRAEGFDDTHVGIVRRQDESAFDEPGWQHDLAHTKWEEGSGVGAAAGAATGVGLGLAVAAGLIPGLGPAIAGGTFMALLASAGTGAAVGTVLGALVGLGIPEDEASFYESEVANGRTVVTVHSADRVTEADAILRAHGSLEREAVAD